jgi:hypothetical protein
MRDTLAAVGRRFPQIVVSVRKTVPATTTYVELGCGGSALTVATSVADRKELPRWAQHRAANAACLNGDLFRQQIESLDGAYAILICGPEVHYGAVSHAPAFIDIGIPAKDYNEYIVPKPLFDEFPQVVSEVLSATPADIDDAYLEMRRRQAEGGSTG